MKSEVDTTRVSAFSKAATATMRNSCSLWYWKLLLSIRLKLRVTCDVGKYRGRVSFLCRLISLIETLTWLIVYALSDEFC